MSNTHLNGNTIAIDPDRITVRLAGGGDAGDLRGLAELDSTTPPDGPSLIADADGRQVAAYSLAERRAIADPFRPTAAVVELLAARARTLTPASDYSGWRRTGLRAAAASSRRRTGVV